VLPVTLCLQSIASSEPHRVHSAVLPFWEAVGNIYLAS
jgi:hypothetical protein